MRADIAMAAVAGVQRAEGVCAYIDAAHAFDTEAARAAGIDLAALLVSQPDTHEQATEILDTLVRTGAIDLIVVVWRRVVPMLPAWSAFATTIVYVEAES